MYKRLIKRVFDFSLSLCGVILLTPIYIILIILGLIKMKGNPFFTQLRPGYHEKVFKLIKFRTMTNEKDKNGNFLPDEVRLNSYGKFLRATSLDELPELFNILKGDMSIVGPRPLLVEYLPWYSESQMHRHDVRPGLTGYAQVHGRNTVNWDEKFKMDVKYVKHVSLIWDIRILIDTVKVVLKHEGISSETSATMESFVDYCQSKGRKPRLEKIK